MKRLILLVLMAAGAAALNTTLTPCPGRYCGRTVRADGSVSDCSACPHAYRSDGYICTYCDSSISPYEALFLANMAIILFIVHVACEFHFHSINAFKVLAVLSLEILTAAIMAVLLE